MPFSTNVNYCFINSPTPDGKLVVSIPYSTVDFNGEIYVFEGLTHEEVPDAPTSLTATSGNTQVSLSWTAPSDDGGDDIIDYLVEYGTNSTSLNTFADGTSNATSAIVTGLTNDQTYYFSVSAINSVGTGNSSSIVTSTPSGNVILYGLNSNSQIYYTAQDSDGAFPSWTHIPGALVTISDVTDSDGNIILYGLNSNSQIYYTAQDSDGGFSSWTHIPGALVTISDVTDSDGNIILYGLNSNSQIYYTAQSDDGTFPTWTHIPGKLVSINSVLDE